MQFETSSFYWEEVKLLCLLHDESLECSFITVDGGEKRLGPRVLLTHSGSLAVFSSEPLFPHLPTGG